MSQRSSRPRARKGGRPSKGHRHLFQSRVPVGLAESVMTEAERRGLTYSDYIALILAEKHQYRLPDFYTQSPDRSPDGSAQEEFPMQTAS